MTDVSKTLRLLVEEFLSRLRVRGAERRLRNSAAELACERIVTQTNPALRGMPGYRRRLLPVARRILEHGESLLRQIPGPIELDPSAWARDPLVNALFADLPRLRQVISGRTVQRWLRDNPDHDGEVFGLLVAMPEERHQLGMELVGDRVQRDIKQTTLSFAEMEVVAVAEGMDVLRRSLSAPLADLIVSLPQARIAARQERIDALEQNLAMLRSKLNSVNPRIGGADLALAAGSSRLAERERLQREVGELERDLADARRGLGDIGEYLESLVQELDHPEREIHLEAMDLWLDRMNVVRDRRSEDAREIRLMRARRSDRPGRVAQFVRFPRRLVMSVDERFDDIERHIA
jgi:hypothetical protein